MREPDKVIDSQVLTIARARRGCVPPSIWRSVASTAWLSAGAVMATRTRAWRPVASTRRSAPATPRTAPPRAGFARNVCVALGNWGSPDAVPVLVRALSDAEPLVRGHAASALGRVGSAEARSALSAHVSVETDPGVLEELSAALDA
jgi:HEAT repeat protein